MCVCVCVCVCLRMCVYVCYVNLCDRTLKQLSSKTSINH